MPDSCFCHFLNYLLVREVYSEHLTINWTVGLSNWEAFLLLCKGEPFSGMSVCGHPREVENAVRASQEVSS